MENPHVTIVKELYAALAAMDWSKYEAHVHPDFRVVESDGLPYAGIFPGMEGFKALITRVFGLFDGFSATPGAICTDASHVMVWVTLNMTGRRTQKSITTELIEVFKFEGDKLIEIRPFYFDTQLISSIA